MEPDHRFLWFLCKKFQKFPDDPEIDDMNPVMRAWMYANWLQDSNDQRKFLDDHGYLIGSFINPELVKRILGQDAQTFESTDEEFDEFSKRLFENNRKEEKALKKRERKRKLKIKE